jgi:hypothetical protein
MSRLHSTFVALVLSAAAAAGLFAVVHSARLGQTVSATHRASVSAREIASRRAKLARWSRSLHHALAKRPPALPKLPKFAPVQAPQASPSTPPAAPVAAATPTTPSVTYVRPKPVVKYQHAPQPATATTSTTATWSDDGGSDDGGGSSEGGGD